MSTIYEFNAERMDGTQQAFIDYKGKVLLIVNTASKCGFTPQFADLEALYQDGVTFPMMAKVEVNGRDAHPIFDWLKQQKGGVLTDGIKWNFTKFLVDSEGQVIERYAPTTKPKAIAADIEQAINNTKQ